MPRAQITTLAITDIKRKAKRLARNTPGKTYMQYLDIVARDMFGVRHFHEARRLAQHAAASVSAGAFVSPMTLYLHACQESYFEI